MKAYKRLIAVQKKLIIQDMCLPKSIQNKLLFYYRLIFKIKDWKYQESSKASNRAK